MAAPQVLLYNPPGGDAKFGAPTGYWSSLQQALSSNLDLLGGRSIILNAAGSALVASSGSGFGTAGEFIGEPQAVVDLLAGGYVWVDWCALPMALRIQRTLGIWTADQFYNGTDGSKVGQALSAMGVTLPSQPQAAQHPSFFAPSGSGLIVPTTQRSFPYPASIVTNLGPTQLPANVILPAWSGSGDPQQPSFSTAQPAYGRSPDGSEQWAYPLLAVAWGKGAYVYAFASDTTNFIYPADVRYQGGVSPADLGTFLSGILASSPQWSSATQGASTLTGVGQPPSITPPSSSAPPPGSKPPAGPNPIVRALEVAGVAVGVLGLGAAWFDYEVHAAEAPHITINTGGH